MKYILFLAMLIGVATSCKKKELMLYEGTDNISFKYDQLSDTTRFTFKTINEPTYDLPVKIKLNGQVKDKMRKLKLIVDADSSTAKVGLHFDALQDTIYLPAGQVEMIAKIRLRKTVDLDNNEYVLTLKLLPNENFDTHMIASVGSKQGIRADRYQIYFSNIIYKGTNWDTNIFGPFSVKKMSLLISVAKLELKKYYVGYGYGYGEFVNMAYILLQYLAKQKKSGNIIFEEDGSAMKMGRIFEME